MQLIPGLHTGLPSRQAAPSKVAAAPRVSSLCPRSSRAASREGRGALQIVASAAADAKHASDGFFVIEAPETIGKHFITLQHEYNNLSTMV
jgi:hypothetical protein